MTARYLLGAARGAVRVYSGLHKIICRVAELPVFVGAAREAVRVDSGLNKIISRVAASPCCRTKAIPTVLPVS